MTAQFNVIPPADYATKIGTVMAGDDLPDVPLQRSVAGQTLFKNVGVHDAEIGKDYVPRNREDLKKVYQ